MNNIQPGSVNAIVTLDIGGGNHVSASISLDAVKELNLTVGSEAYAIVKATSVMIGIDD